MAGTPFRHRGAIEKNRDNTTRIDAMTVKVTEFSGRVQILGAGESAVDIQFPVLFSERPVFTYGGELDENHHPVAGSYPTISAIVDTWDQVGKTESSDGRFKGARVVVVTTGTEGQHMWLHFSFTAKAMRNPLNTLDSVDDTL